jgi:hypothetical protein
LRDFTGQAGVLAMVMMAGAIRVAASFIRVIVVNA